MTMIDSCGRTYSFIPTTQNVGHAAYPLMCYIYLKNVHFLRMLDFSTENFQNIINIVVPVWLSLPSSEIKSGVRVPPGAWNVYVMIVTKKALGLVVNDLFPTYGSCVEAVSR